MTVLSYIVVFWLDVRCSQVMVMERYNGYHSDSSVEIRPSEHERDEELYAQYFIEGMSNIKCPKHILDVESDSCAKCGQHMG
jgi:hypothetical protein